MKSPVRKVKKTNFNGANNDKYGLDAAPTAKQRAELIVKRLENLIREGQADKRGVSFKRWQEMAVQEFTNAILDTERYLKSDNRFLTRVILVCALAIITIGFWGAVVAAGVSYDRQIIAFILFGAGSVLLLAIGSWGLRQLNNRFIITRRQQRLKQIDSFDQQLAQLDLELKEKLNN